MNKNRVSLFFIYSTYFLLNINNANANLSVKEGSVEQFSSSLYDNREKSVVYGNFPFGKEEELIWQISSFHSHNREDNSINSRFSTLLNESDRQFTSVDSGKDGADIIIEPPYNKNPYSFIAYMEENLPWAFFFITFLSNPKETGAFVPSSRSLAKKMINGVKKKLEEFSSSEKKLNALSKSIYKVLEVGAGSGIFTEEMIRNGIPEESIFLVESQEKFVKSLKKKFSKISLFKGYIQDLLKKHPEFEKEFPVIISALPLKNFYDPVEREEIFNVIFRCIKEGGFLRQFTYRFSSPITSEELRKVEKKLGCRIKEEYEGWVLRNFPPARVYKYTVTQPRTISCCLTEDAS